MAPKTSYVSVTDMFCGAGGSSIGVTAHGATLVVAANHWARAIETHNSNFPNSLHVLTDIRTADPRRFPTTDVLVASPECTAHTLAKGRKRKAQGQLDLFGKSAFDPAEERSRATMWDVPRFAEYHRYNIVIVENVVDAALYWEPYTAWLQAMHLLGYQHEEVFYNAMFAHPTPQSRDRLYIVFWRTGNSRPNLALTPAAWCTSCSQDVAGLQAWKNLTRRGKYGARNQYVYRCPHCTGIVHPYYYAAANAIDWSLSGERIGDRARPLQPKTLKRIRYGLERYARQPFTLDTCYGSESGRTYPRTAPMRTQTTQQNGALLVPAGGTWNESAKHTSEPMPTQTTRDQYGLVQAPNAFLLSFYGERHGTHAIDDPMVTVAGRANHALVGCLRAHSEPRPVSQPVPSVIAGGNQHYLLVPYYGNSRPHEVSEPLGSVTTHDRDALLGTAPAVEDCTFRMLQPHEIQAAMAFPSDYRVSGTSREKVKQLGNAVCPPVMQAIFERCVETLGRSA